MPVQNTDTVNLSLPGGALRADVRAGGTGVVVAADGVQAIGQYGAEAVMSMQAGGLVVNNFPVGVNAARTIVKFSDVDLDYSEFSTLPQADAQNGVFTLHTDGVYLVEFNVSARMITPSVHASLEIWTDCGNPSIPLPSALLPLTEGVAYGVGWQRIGMSNTGYTAASPVTPYLIAENPAWFFQVQALICIRTPPFAAALQSPSFASALPAPCRFLLGTAVDTSNALNRILAPTNGFVRWLGPVP